MVHRWELVQDDPSRNPSVRSDVRTYACARCGAGPITVRTIDGKRGIRRAAKNLGFDMDCSVQVTREVMES